MPLSCLSAVGDHSYDLALIKHPGTTIHIRGTYSARWDFFSFLPGIGAVPGITNTSSLRAFFLARLCSWLDLLPWFFLSSFQRPLRISFRYGMLPYRWMGEWLLLLNFVGQLSGFFLPFLFLFPLVLGARRLRLLLIASTGTWIRLGTNLVIV